MPTELRPDTPIKASNEQIAAAGKVYLQLQALTVEADRQDGLLRDQTEVIESEIENLNQEMNRSVRRTASFTAAGCG